MNILYPFLDYCEHCKMQGQHPLNALSREAGKFGSLSPYKQIDPYYKKACT